MRLNQIVRIIHEFCFDVRVARRRRQKSCEHVDDGSLASPVRPEQCKELALRHTQPRRLYRVEFLAPSLECSPQAADLDRRAWCHWPVEPSLCQSLLRKHVFVCARLYDAD